MITFNIVFAVATLLTLLNLSSLVAYTRAIKYGITIAGLPQIQEAMKSNTFYKTSLIKSASELERFGVFWFSVAQSAFLAVVISWVFGALNNGTISELDVFVLSLAVTSALARPITAPILNDWLGPWIVGLQAVLIVCQKQAIETRIGEIMAYDDYADNPSAYVELQLLNTELNKLNTIIGTVPVSPQSENAE